MQNDDDELTQLLLDETDSEDQVMTKFFIPTKILGQGAFCTVISAYDILSESQVAIKILSKGGFKKSQVDMLKKESTILNKLNHPNIVRLKMSKETSGKIYLVMEEIKGSCLEDYINERKYQDKPLQEYEIKEITKQIVKAIKYFHEKNIIHRDLKPENILIEEIEVTDSQRDIEQKFKIKIIDFGLSIQMESIGYQPLHDNCGTLLYMAPEAAQKKDYDRSVDIWSLGVVIFIMFTMGKHPFWNAVGETKKSYIEKMKNPLFTYWPDNIDQKVCNFITKTATRRPDCRMTATQCLRHPWLLGEGQISDPITMGDMITTFSNMQGFVRLTKSILVIHHLIQKMSTVNSVIKRTIHIQQLERSHREIPKQIIESHRQTHSSDGSSASNILKEISNQSNSDTEESIKTGGLSQHTKQLNTPQSQKNRLAIKTSYAQSISKQLILTKATAHTNSAGMISRKQSSGFSTGNIKKSFDWSKNDMNKVRLTHVSPKHSLTQFDKQPDVVIDMAQSNILQQIETSPNVKMFQSTVFQNINKNRRSDNPEKLMKIRSNPQQDMNMIRLPYLGQKPPVGRKSIQFLKEDSIMSSSSNSQGSNSNKNTQRIPVGVKSFFSKQ